MRKEQAGCAPKDRLVRCDNFSPDSSWGKFAKSGTRLRELKGSALIHFWAGFVPGLGSTGMFFPSFLKGLMEW